MKEPKEVKELTNFIDKEINNNLREYNAGLFFDGVTEIYTFLYISFNRDHKENYKKVAAKIIELGGLIKSTELLNNSITAAFKNDN